MSTVELRYDRLSIRPLPERIPLLFIDGERTYGMYVVEITNPPPIYELWLGDKVIMTTHKQPAIVERDDGLTAYIWRDVEVTR